MGGDPSQLMSHALRGIKSSDPKNADNTGLQSTSILSNTKYARVIGLKKQAEKQGFTVTVQNGYEKVDQDLLRACRKVYTRLHRLQTTRLRVVYS
jgi:hypothetical protein